MSTVIDPKFIFDAKGVLGRLESDSFWQAAWFFFHKEGRLKDAYLWKKSFFENYLESRAADDSEVSFAECLKICQVLMWLSRYDEINSKKLLLKELITSKTEESVYSIFYNTIELFEGNAENSLPDERNADFEKYLHGKDIVISGPSASAQKVEVSNKILVKFNFVQLEEQIPSISYYSRGCFMTDRDKILNHLRNKNIEYAIVNALKSGDLEGVNESAKAKVRRVHKFYAHDTTHLMGLQRCLVDLLVSKPKSLYITNTDFYTRYPYHSSNYKSIDKIKDLLKSWSIHDLFFSYNITKRLFDRGMVSGDSVFTKVMEMGIEEYIRVVEKQVIRQLLEK